ncbi:MAG: PilZ domain-containing protein [Elusimicrobia bacterium]|nr:PilZ domain-containing protein [Elusimicrobiota bacterium]
MFKTMLRIFKVSNHGPSSKNPNEKRRAPRIVELITCSVYDHIRFQTRKDCLVHDISLFGVCLDADFPVGISDQFTLGFTIGRREFKQVKASIVWTARYKNGFRCGLAFDSAVANQIQKALVEQIKGISI